MTYLLLFFGLLFASFSCGKPPEPSPGIPGAQPAPPPIRRATPKTPDPVKIADCSRMKRGQTCEQDEDCKEICDDVFSSRGDKKKCYEFSEDLVSGFEELLESTEDGEVEDIDALVLECMLDIDEREFARAVKKMSRREAKDFLAAIANDDDLARVLEEEDDEFLILSQLLYKAAGNNDLIDQLAADIEDRKSFLYLSAESGEDAWEWLDSYVDDTCDSASASLCFDGENIGAYCQALLRLRDKPLEDFLSDGDRFAEEYEDEVEDDEYAYEVDSNPSSRYKGDFKDWCKIKIDPTSVPCPADGTYPGDDNRLTTITFVGDPKHFIQGPHCKDANDPETSGNTFTESQNTAAGDDDPAQATILSLQDGETSWNLTPNDYGYLILDTSKITNFDSSKTYYLYVGDKRFDLEGGVEYTEHANCDHQRDLVLFTGFSTSQFAGSTPKDIVLASEENGECKFYTTR